MKLSAKQKEIVDTTEKYSYVIAGAGSGKTRTLTERIRRILNESKQGEKVLALTFSNRAAHELKERLLDSYAESELADLVYVGTIHTFCMELVLQRGSAIGLSSDLHIFETLEDRLEIFGETLNSVPQMREKYLKNDSTLDSKRIRELFDTLSKAKRDFKFPEDYDSKPFSQLLYREYNERMQAQNAIDFDDILLYAYRILVEKESIARIYQRVYRHVCVDEAQDLNRAQYEVIKAIAGASSTIFMVGDPNQAIYGFNGSSPRYMTAVFPKDYSAKKFELLDNYRSSKSVINAAKLIEPSFKMEGHLPIIGECTQSIFVNEAEEARWILSKIEGFVNNGHPDVEQTPIPLSKCAVLARNKYVFSSLIELLEDSTIEYHIRASAVQGLSSESTFFRVFDLGLRLLINVSDSLHLAEMMRLLKVNNQSIGTFNQLRKTSLLQDELGEEAANAIEQSWSILEKQQNFKFDKVIETLTKYCHEKDNYPSDDERLLVVNDLETWSQRFGTYIKNSALEDRNLSHLLRSIALGITNTLQEKGLTLSTIHMAKGLEFEVVFIMGLCEGTFPDYRALGDTDQLLEERHNMFVALTRSKRLCYLTAPQEKLMPWGSVKKQTPSQFLSALTQED